MVFLPFSPLGKRYAEETSDVRTVADLFAFTFIPTLSLK